jgi:hypothetical protein
MITVVNSKRVVFYFTSVLERILSQISGNSFLSIIL